MDYKTNERYFRTVNWKKTAVGIVICLLIGLAVPSFFIFAIIGGAWLFWQNSRKVPGSTVDQALEMGLKDITKRALDQLNLEESQVALVPPVIISGYNYERFAMAKREGTDGPWRTSDAKGIVIFFDDAQLHSYCYEFSLTNPDRASLHQTDQYFYRDVVSIQTATASWKPPDGAEQTYERFLLTTSGGTSISCSIHDQGNRDALKGARTLINEKKRGA